MTESSALELLNLYLDKKASPKQEQELFEWINAQPDDAPIRHALQQAWIQFTPQDKIDVQQADSMLQQILQGESVPAPTTIKRRFELLKWSAAAAVLAVISTAAYYYITAQNRARQTEIVTSISSEHRAQKQDIPPGTTSAKLTLGDGSEVLLDTLTGQSIATQGSTQIIKTGGQVLYKNNNESVATIYNTLSTDRGHQYPLTLSDGTKVFLNASSSIHFPVSFNGPQRSVEITGEAYFEVAKNGKPFIVHAGGTQVEVMGTHFNVNAYADEAALNTTLLEGSVKVSQGMSSLMLVPGQQAQVRSNGSVSLNKNADTEAAVSWVQGYFHFSDAGLEDVLRQLARWYDVDVVYEKHYPDETFGGDIQKSLTLSQVLKLLDKSQVNFRILGKQLILMK